MALAKVVAGKKLLIKISSGGETPVFAHPCSINAGRSFNVQSETNDTRVPDCDDPELISFIKREKISVSGSVQGAGVLHSSDFADWFEWATSGDKKDVRIELGDVLAADGGGYIAGSFLCTGLEITGDLGEFVQVSLTLLSDGAFGWVDAA